MEGENTTEKGLLLVNKEEISANTTPLLFFSTFIIVSASFTFGAAMGYTADTMSSIMTDLDLSVAQFSLFGSLMTFGGMFGAIVSAKAAAAFGYKMTLWLADLFCITGWHAIVLAKNIIWLDMGRFLVGTPSNNYIFVTPSTSGLSSTTPIKPSSQLPPPLRPLSQPPPPVIPPL